MSETQQKQTNKPATTGDTVTVACRLPMGLILSLPSGEKVALNGTSLPSPIKGIGLTHGISKDFWDAWVKLKGQSDLVKKNIVFAQATPDRMKSAAKEILEGPEKTGFEKMPQAVKDGGTELSPDKDAPGAANL